MTISVVFGRRYLPASAEDMKTENNTLQIFARENKTHCKSNYLLLPQRNSNAFYNNFIILKVFKL